jgi:hypothetical protein
VADLSPHELGQRARAERIVFARNPFPKHSADAAAWEKGWIMEAIAQHDRAKSASTGGGCAVVLPHPILTGAQIDILCRREGLALERLGQMRYRLVQMRARREITPRIASPRYDGPEAA